MSEEIEDGELSSDIDDYDDANIRESFDRLVNNNNNDTPNGDACEDSKDSNPYDQEDVSCLNFATKQKKIDY